MRTQGRLKSKLHNVVVMKKLEELEKMDLLELYCALSNAKLYLQNIETLIETKKTKKKVKSEETKKPIKTDFPINVYDMEF